MEGMFRREIVRKLSYEDIRYYKGPIHCIHHHEVLKPESKSRPLLTAFNSSASYMGESLNELCAKGPDVLNSLLGVLLELRREKVAVASDIYNQNVLCHSTLSIRPAWKRR